MPLERIVQAGIANKEVLDLLEQCILDVARQRYGEVRITIKGSITHISSTFSYTAKNGLGANPDPHYRSSVGKNER